MKKLIKIIAITFFPILGFSQSEIRVEGKGYEIIDGTNSWPDSTGQAFGVHQANVDSLTHVFWVFNEGTSNLILSNFDIRSSVNNFTHYDAHFNITDPTNLVVLAGDSISFSVQYKPTATGTHGRTTAEKGRAWVQFTTNDADEATYNFSISGAATPNNEFDCSSGRILFSANNPTDLFDWNYKEQPPTLTTIRNNWNAHHDGMAMNPNDNFIYAMRWTANNRNQLWVFDQSGEETFVGYVSGGTITNNMNPHFSAGTFDNKNNLCVFQNGNNSTGFHKINIKSQQAEQMILSQQVHILDVIFNPSDGLLYGFSHAGLDGLVSISPIDGTVTLIGGDGSNLYHALFRSSDGQVYMMTKTYIMYAVDLSDGSLTQIGANPGWGNGAWVDGTACGSIPLNADLSVSETDNRPSYTLGGIQSYTVTVKNNGPMGVYGATVQDLVPTGITGADMSWTTETFGTASSQNMGGTGALNDVINIGVGDSVKYTVRIIVPTSFTGNLTNTATVTPPSFITDVDLSNNTAIDIDVPVLLSAEQCNNGFDDDGDGMVDCFDGDCFGNSLCSDGFFGLVPPECQEAPPVTSTFNMVEKYRNNNADDYTQPLVADMDGDGLPEIFSYNASNRLYLINGEDGSTQTTMSLQHTQFSQGAGIADVDRDGFAEIFMLEDGNRRLHRFDHNGNLVYSGDQFGQGGVVNWDQQHTVSPAFADFNGDGLPEIYMGNNIFDPATGKVLVRGGYSAAKGTHMSWWQQYSVAYDILSDDFCADCDGMELICGNTVYSVNNITFKLTSIATHPRGDGYTALTDINQDGEMDIVVATGNNNGSYIYVWDPRTGLIVPTDSKGNALPDFLYLGRDYGGQEQNLFSIPSIADFDGDGINEIGIITPYLLTILEPDLSIGAQLPTTDQSGATTMTSFDFEGDGEIEIVYRDETNLRILKYDTLTGTIITKSTTACGSGTRTEGPVIADVDADGEAEICISCRGSGGSSDYLAVFESDDARAWMPTRKVWNQHNYVPIWVNDDLTIPATFQAKNSVPGQDTYLSQTALMDSLGNLIFPALPDFVVTIDSARLGSCTDDSITVHVTICNDDAASLIYDYPLSFYEGNPTSGGTLLGTKTVTVGNTVFVRESCYVFSFNIRNMPTNLYVLVNDDGTGNFGYPTTLIKECDSTNNQANENVGCVIDAGITKDDGQLSYIPGGPVTYKITARNLGPNFTGGVVSDPLPVGVSAGNVTWTATTYGGATTKAIGTMNGALQDTVDITGGDSVVYSVTITTPATLVGDLVNTVTITVAGDTILTNNTATDIDPVDCSFAISGTVNSRTAAWQEIGTVRSGSTYNINTSAGFKTFTATNGPESGKVINSVIYNTGSNNHVSLTKNKYNPSNNWLATVGTYDNKPHAWTGLSGVAPENAPVLGFMAFVDQNGDGIFNSGSEEYIRDINTLSVIPTTTGQLYMAFYDDGPYNDNNGIMTINASVNSANVSIGNDTTICEGNSVTLDAGNPGSTYLWNTSATTQTIQSASTGQYSVVVNTGGGCLVRDTVNVIVDRIIVKLRSNTSLCVGDSVLLDAGNIGANYLWSTGETTQTIQAKTAMQYSVAATVANGCIGRDTIVISQIPMLNLGLGNDTAICVGESINFTFTKPIGSSQIWNTGSTMQTISADSAAAYSVLVTDSNGCLNHDTIVLSLNPLPIVNLGNDTTICSGTSITLTPQNIGSTYLWNDGSSGQRLIVSAVGEYFVEETNSLGCIGKDTIEIIALDTLPLVDLGPDSIMICSGSSITLDGGNTGSSYLWHDSSTNQTFNTSTLGKYFVQVKNGNNCIASDTLEINAFFPLPPVNIGNDTSICIGTSVTLDAGPASSWAWLPSGNTSTITASLAGTYSVEISDSNGCIGRDTVLISNDTLPAITLGNDTSICEGDTVDLVTVLGLTSYLWTNNASTTNIAKVFTTNTYEVTGTDLNGCENTASIDVTVNPLPVIGLADSSNYCVYGQNLIISVFESGATYLWNNGLATQQIPITSVGTYWVDVTNVNNCFETDTVVITSDYLTINLGPDQTVCEKDSVLLDAGNYPLEIWNLTDTASTYNVFGTEKVSVIAIDADGCFGVDTIMITQTLKPTIDVVKTDSTICDLIGEETSVYVVNPQGMSVSWNSGETGQNIPVAKIGTYVATVTNGDNCSASDSVFIDRSCDTVPFTMPNIFTPNTDGINDDFVPVEDPVTLKDYFKSIDFIVYNRWGRTVYLSSDVLPFWNGENIETGNLCSVGVYFWVIEYKDIYGKIERINGFVHLAK